MSLPNWLTEFLTYATDRSLSFLLVFLLLLLFVVYPFFTLQGFAGWMVDVSFSLVLVAATLSVKRRSLRKLAMGLLIVTLVTRWATYTVATREVLILNTLLAIIYILFAGGVILGRVFADGPVTSYRIQGAVAVHLLVALVFAMVYTLIALFDVQAFDMDPLSMELTARELYDQLMGRMSYFSFITLTTVGYGDITPVNDVAKQFAVLEGLVGQLFPAILLARLVSLEVASRYR